MQEFKSKSWPCAVDDTFLVSRDQWTISLVCVRGKEHGFLVIQGIEAGQGDAKSRPVFWRSDLWRHKDSTQPTKLTGRAFIPELRELEAAEGRVEFARLARQDRLIQSTWRRSSKDVRRLMASIESDRKSEIAFNLSGDNSSGSTLVSQCGNYHNCISWARAKLEVIGITLPSSNWERFFQLVAVRPSAVIEDAQNETPASWWCSLL